jgi:hypothetical protein
MLFDLSKLSLGSHDDMIKIQNDQILLIVGKKNGSFAKATFEENIIRMSLHLDEEFSLRICTHNQWAIECKILTRQNI